MFRNIGELQEALAIQQDGKITIARIVFPDLAVIIGDCYGGEPIILSGAERGDDDGVNETVVRTGRSSFLGCPDLAVVAAFKLVTGSGEADRLGTVKVTLRYTLPTGWKFSHSFPELPKVIDWRKTAADPLSVPLDDLTFASASLAVTNHRHEESGVLLRTGINFIGKVLVSDQEPTAAVTAAIKRWLGYNNSELLLTGTINLLQPNDTLIKTPPELWPGSHTRETSSPNGGPLSASSKPVPPGILLSADLGLNKALGSSPDNGLSLDNVCFRIYSPTSSVWPASNSAYAPGFAYTGTLSLPKANLTASLSFTAFQELGGDELVLSGHFTNASIRNLAGLKDLGGSNDLHGSMGGTLKSAVDDLLKLELMYASLEISMKRGIDVSRASVKFGMPDLNWTVLTALKDVFAIKNVAALIEIRHPFSTGAEDPMDRFRFGKHRVDVTVMGRLEIFAKKFDFMATVRSPYTFNAQLAEGESIQLSDLIRKYPNSLPPLQANPVIDYLALTAQHSGESGDSSANRCAFAGRITSKPKLEILPGLKLSEVAVFLKVTGASASVDGEIRAVLTIGKIDVSLKSQKKGQDWLFVGSVLQGQTVEFLPLAREKVNDKLALPLKSFGFPEKLTIKNADVSVALSKGEFEDFDFTGDADFENWEFQLGSASFRVTGLGGGIHLSKTPGKNRATLYGRIEIGEGINADAGVQLGEDGVDTIIQVALQASSKKPTVSSAIERVAGAGGFTSILPAGLPDKLHQFSSFVASIDLTKNLYFIEGSIEDFGWAYLVYHGVDADADADAKAAYVFAAGLGPGFQFGKLLSGLESIDSTTLTVKEAMLAVYSLDPANSTEALAGLNALVTEFQKKNPGVLALPNVATILADESGRGHEGLILTADIEVGEIFGNKYEFRGWLKLNSERMQGWLDLSTSPSSTLRPEKIRSPFQLIGIDITRLKLGMEKKFDGTPPSIALLGFIRLGWHPGDSTPDLRPELETKLSLLGWKPALMSIALLSDLKVGELVAQCITGNRDKWPDKFFELTLKSGSRAYYFDDQVPGTAAWKNSGTVPVADKYMPGFNVEADAKIALGNSTVSLGFLLSKKQGGFIAGGALKSPVELWCIQLAGTGKSGKAYTGGPALEIDAKGQGRQSWKFTLTVGVNLFRRAICTTEVSISRPNAGGTQLMGTIRCDDSLEVFGKLSLKFIYVRHEDGRSQTFAITEWPAFDVLRDVFEIFKTIQELADKLVKPCDFLAGFLSDRLTSTKMNYSVTPSATAEGENLKFMLGVECTMSTVFGDVQILDLEPNVSIHKDIALSDLPDKLMEKVPAALANALLQPRSVRASVGLALFLAITFGKDGVKIALALACRGLVNTVVAAAVEILVDALAVGAAALLAAIVSITALFIRTIFGSDPPAQKPVLKLTPPAAEKLTFSDAGGEDRVRLSWKWPGDASDFAFDAQLVDANGIVRASALPDPSSTGASFDSAQLPVAIFRARTQAKAKPSSKSASLTIPSDWSAPSGCVIAKLPVANIAEIGYGKAGAYGKSSVEVSMGSAVAGADVYYARLFYPGANVTQVEFNGNTADLVLPGVYHGRAQIGIRAAKRDGSAISSDWNKRDLDRLTRPVSATCTYDHGKEKLMLRFSPTTPAVPASLSYQYQVFTGPDAKPFGNPLPVGDPAGVTEVPVGELPAGPLQIAVRAVASAGAQFVPSAWCIAQPALRKLAEAVVTDISYDQKTGRVHIKLEDAGHGIVYKAKFDMSGNFSQSSVPEIDCPNPFDPGTFGTRTVSARLTSADTAVIDGKWREAGPGLKLTKFPPPANPALVWDDQKGELAVSFTASSGVALHEVQCVANNQPFGLVFLTEVNSSRIGISLDDNLPPGSIAVQVRSTGPAPSTVAGDWVGSNALDRQGHYAVQPQIFYTPGEEWVTVQWRPSATSLRLQVQLLSGQTVPVGTALNLNFPVAPAPIRDKLNFGDDLPAGQFGVRFRIMPRAESEVPGQWSSSTQPLDRLASASRVFQGSYVDGVLTIPVFTVSNDPLPTAFDLSFGTLPAIRVPAILPERRRAELIVQPESFPPGVNPVKVVPIGEANRTVNGAATYLMFSLCPLGRPAITRVEYASGKLTLAWDKVEFIFGSTPSEAYNVKIDAGDGNVKIHHSIFESERAGSSVTSAVSTSRVLELGGEALESLPAGVWQVSVQAVGLYGNSNGTGSGPWSKSVSVFILEPPADLQARAETANLSVEWEESAAARRTYDVELSSPILAEPRVWHNLEATLRTTADAPAIRIASVNCDISTLREGIYDVRVRTVVGLLQTAWSKAKSINVTADLGGAFAYRKIGPSKAVQRYSYTIGGAISLHDSHFDNLDEVKRLKMPLSEVVVYRDYRGQVGGIQGYYGYGNEKTAGSVHGAGQEWQRIEVPADGRITRISGSASALNPEEYRVDGIRFDGKGVQYPRTPGNPMKLGRDSFSFEAQHGEVVVGFFGTTYPSSYADLTQAGIKYLGSFGVWMKRVYAEMRGKFKKISVGSKDHVWGIDSSDRLWRYTGDDTVWPFVQVPAPGNLDQLSVGADGTVLVSIKHPYNAPNVFRLKTGSPEEWVPIQVAAKHISGASSENVWGMSVDGSVWRYSGSDYLSTKLLFETRTFDEVSGSADGTVWGIKGGEIYRFDRQPFSSIDYVATPIPGSLVQIFVGSKQNVWGRQATGQIVRYTGNDQNRWEQIPGSLGNVDQVAVGADGTVWGVKADKIYRCESGTWAGI